ncbi:MAG: hypothetical protein ED559_03725 [Phycisphaera sp.]|nr:MAG: hypothetical protein ED559_03725 [Phycisphaera sp.]
MAKRRNAPALFELLRETNSTKSGQVGNEQMRERLGGGSVDNTAPRPPGHPAVIAAKEAEERARREAAEAERKAEEALAAQVASEKVLEAKSGDNLDINMDALLSMPSFKAGREVESSEPTPAEPEANTPDTTASSEPTEQAKAPEPDTGAEKPVAKKKPEKKPEPKVIKPEPVKEPETKIESKVDVTSEADVKASKPAVETGVAPAVASKETGTTSERSEAKGSQADSPVDQKPVAVGQFGLTPVKLGMFGAFAVLLIFAIFVIAYSLGKSDAREEFKDPMRDEASKTLAGMDGEDASGAGGEDKPIDPLQIAQDDDFIKPGIITPPQNNDQADDSAEETPANQPIEITNEDTREPGVNYLHLAPLADAEEARRLQIYLAEHGIMSFIRTGDRGGRTVHEPITLVGIESDGFKTSTRKISHEREIQRLGGIWFQEHGGSVDYSRPNQWVWYKAPSQ